MTQTDTRRALRIAVYVFLVASAGAAFLFGDWLRAAAQHGDVPMWTPLVAPGIFTLFVVVYAIDRWLLAKRRRHSLGRAFIQVVFAIVFAGLLWIWPEQPPRAGDDAGAGRGQDFRVALLDNPDPNVRAAACELLAWRGEREVEPRLAALAEHDTSARVREACAQAVARLGRDPVPAPPL